MLRLTTLVLLLPGIVLAGDTWPRFHGPDGNGIADDKDLPVKWDADTVRWKTAIPGEGFSSPVVWHDRIFVTSARDKGDKRLIHCLDRKTGKLLWTQELTDKNPELASAMTGHAASTPATDGKHVVAFFGNAGAVCYDMDGKRLWHRSLGEFDVELGLASSPVIHGDRVFLVCDHDGDRFRTFASFLVALDVNTGKEVWKTERREQGRSWSSPILVPTGKDLELIVSSEDRVRAYDPTNGKELWNAEGTTNWVTPTPVFGHGLIFVTSGKNGPTLALKPGGRSDVTKTHVVWKHDEGGPYVTSPLLYGEYLYTVREEGTLTCFEAKTGKEVYKERLKGKFTSSPVAGDGKVYATNEDGVTFVIRAGNKFELLARNELGEYTLATPAIVGGCLFLRTEKQLYCVEKK